MQGTLTISGKLLGKHQSLFSDWHLPLPSQIVDGKQEVSFKDLLVYIIKAEIEAFQTRQAQRKLISVLSQEEISQGKLAGKIEMGGKDFEQNVDADLAIETALQAFEDGFYYVFLDDQQIESLAQSVVLGENSQLLFLRLVPLVGG